MLINRYNTYDPILFPYVRSLGFHINTSKMETKIIMAGWRWHVFVFLSFLWECVPVKWA